MLGGDWERSALHSDLLTAGRSVPAFAREPAKRREEQDEDKAFRCISSFVIAFDRLRPGNSNAAVVEFGGVGHGASVVEGCPRDMLIAFLNDPTSPPDDACLAEMGLQFIVPTGEEVAIELEPFTHEIMGITGLKPVGWSEAGPGVFARGSSGLDIVSVIQQSADGSADHLLATLSSQLRLDEIPTGVDQREANGLTWTLYHVVVQNISVDFALAEGGGLALIVLLQSPRDERETLYEQVYLPAIDTLVPVQ